MEKSSTEWQDDSARKQRPRSSKKESNQSGRKLSVNRPAKEHTFLTDVANVRTMEHGLLTLLNDFHSGKLQAFGSNATFNKMDAIRIQQEQLAKQHFELDLLPRSASSRMNAEESRKENSEKMDKLIEQLHDLSYSVDKINVDGWLGGSITLTRPYVFSLWVIQIQMSTGPVFYPSGERKVVVSG